MDFLSHRVRDYRLRSMHAFMDQRRLDALLFTSADYFEFASNFKVDVETWERPIFLIVPRNGACVAVMNELSTNHYEVLSRQERVWIADVQFYIERRVRGGDRPVVADMPRLAAEALNKLGLANSRVGVDALPPFLVSAAEQVAGLQLCPCNLDLRSLRWVKHAEEIAIMRQACSLADWAQERYRESVRPGRLVQDLDLQIAALIVEEGARRFPGADLEIAECFTLNGPASAAPHGNSARCGARIAAGDVLVNIIIPRLNGLFIENERTWFVGKPSAEQRKYYEAARAANEAGVNAAVAGWPVSGIDAAAQAEMVRAGFGDLMFHRTGHGMGILGHEYPDDMSFNDRALMTNEVYSVEPGIYVQGLGGFRIDDTVVVGEKPDVLTTSPRDIESQIVI